MPCAEPNLDREDASVRVCKLLVYALPAMSLPIPPHVRTAAEDPYGNAGTVDEDTDMLCRLCRGMSELEKDRIIYNGRNPDARRLADWWECHQEVDRKAGR